MVKKTTTKTTKVTARSTKKAVARPVKKSVKRVKPNKVDYYPNRMALAVSALAAVTLLLLALLATMNW